MILKIFANDKLTFLGFYMAKKHLVSYSCRRATEDNVGYDWNRILKL